MRRFLSFLPISIFLNRAQLLNALVPPPISFLKDTPVSKRPKTCPKTVQKRAPPPGMRHLKTREVLALIWPPFTFCRIPGASGTQDLWFSGPQVLRLSGSQGSWSFFNPPEETGRSFIGHKSALYQKKSFCCVFGQHLHTLSPPTNFSKFESASKNEVAGVTI